MKKFYIFIALATFFCFCDSAANAQNNIGIGTTTPDASSILEMQSTTQGVLVPRMLAAARLAIAATANGLLVYDLDSMCFFFYKAGIWTNMCNATSSSSGPTGPTGAVGLTGPSGANGSTGPTGIHCWDLNGNNINDPAEDINSDGVWDALDCRGAIGAVGPTGAVGANGATGVAGPVGPTGPTGFGIGPTGPTGANGTNGATGPTGSAGPTGAAGAAGPTGAAGAAGPTGAAGAAGPTGAAGAAGPTGAAGAAGPTGAAGAAGPTGAAGAAGPTGPAGPVGCASPNYLIKSNGVSATCTVAPVFEDASGSVGIGTTTPYTSSIGAAGVTRLHVYGSSIAGGILEEHINIAAAGTGFIFGNTSAANNYNALEGVTYGTYSALFGLHIPVTGAGYGGYFVTNSSNAGAIGAYCQMPAASPGWALYVNGDAVTTGATWYLSDRKLKTNIIPLENPLDKLMRLNVYSYNYKPELINKYGLHSGENMGVIADEVETVFPELIKDTKLISSQDGKPNQTSKNDGMEIKSVNYIGFIPVLIGAIKEQQGIIDSLKTTVQQQQVQINQLILLQQGGQQVQPGQEVPQQQTPIPESTQSPVIGKPH